MPQTYYTLITQAGLDAMADALASSSSVELTKIGVGDGGGAVITPAVTDTALTNELYLIDSINQIIVDPNKDNRVIVEAVMPQDHSDQYSGIITIREVGVYFDDGGVDTLFAIAKFPEVDKPLVATGSGIDVYIRVGLEHVNVSTVTLLVDPSVVLVSRDWAEASFVFRDGDKMTGKLKTAGVDKAYSEKTADFLVVDTDEIIELNAGSGYGNVDGELLDATAYPGKYLVFKAIDITNTASLTPKSGQSIEGLSAGESFVFSYLGQVLALYSDGVGWQRAFLEDIENTYSVDTGVADAYVITLVPSPGVYTEGLEINVKMTSTNTGASTINVNGLGIKNIKKLSTLNLVAGDITAGQVVTLVYDGTSFQMTSHVPDTPQVGLGAWLSRVDNTVYQAATDGFVVASCGVSTGVSVFSDGSNPPTTVRAADEAGVGEKASVTIPVRKGDYWKTVNANSSVWWIPIGT